MIIMKGILLEAGAFGKDLQEPQDQTQISRDQRDQEQKDLEISCSFFDPCWGLGDPTLGLPVFPPVT